jgi:hypothetical protein
MRALVLVIAAFLINIGICAQSNVYIFVKSIGSSDTKILVDGKVVADLNGSVKKTYNLGMGENIPFKMLQACYRKLTVNHEGKTIISCDIEYLNCLNGVKTQYKAEIALDLENGESYYLDLVGKGRTDMQIKAMSEKEAVKKIKKVEELPEVIIE